MKYLLSTHVGFSNGPHISEWTTPNALLALISAPWLEFKQNVNYQKIICLALKHIFMSEQHLMH
jgi:hypothetical protein